jgi:hypothetical protein
MARHVKSNTKFNSATPSPRLDLRQADMGFDRIVPLISSEIDDEATQDLILWRAPIEEPEVTAKKTKQKALRKSAAKKPTIKSAAPKPKKTKATKSKEAKKLPVRVAKTVKKNPPKRTLSKQGVASADNSSALAIPTIKVFDQAELMEIGNDQSRCPMEIERLAVENGLGISAIAFTATDSSPPWVIEPEINLGDEIKPLPRSASLQLYGSSNWFGVMGHWLRRNWISAFTRKQKQPKLTVNRPAAKKLRPKEMVIELNRLAEENRALRRQLMQASQQNAPASE